MKKIIATIFIMAITGFAMTSKSMQGNSTVLYPKTTAEQLQIAYYGQYNSYNNSYRTNYTNGYYKSNGTYVNGYYHS